MSTEVASDEIDRLIERGVASHAGIVVTSALRELVAARAAAALAACDTNARASDVVLAAACACGDPAALAILNDSLAAIVRPALARLGHASGDDDEIVQRVRVALLVPNTTGALGIAGYSGRGELRAFIRSVAVKLALKRIEREEMASPTDDTEMIEMLPSAADTPATRLLKERCRGELRAAFAVAFAAIEPKERMLLRQHYLDSLTIDALARLHGVHRATCARWLEAAREQVLRGVRRYFRQTLGLADADLDDALALVRSQLDLSLSHHLPHISS